MLNRGNCAFVLNIVTGKHTCIDMAVLGNENLFDESISGGTSLLYGIAE
jgi:hypothetical protein